MHRHRLVKTGPLAARGDALSGRVPLFFNSDVTMGVCLPAEAMATMPSTATAKATRCSSSTAGEGVLETVFGDLRYGPGDYLVLPIGTTWRLEPDSRLGAADALAGMPQRARASQALSERVRPAARAQPLLAARHPVPTFRPPNPATGDFRVAVKARGRLTTYHYAGHPFDVVGWDGYLWPYAFNIGDFEPITGRVHQPPPVHQTFQGHNFVVCSFVPRKFDYHPLSIPAPYNHSNINSDEVIYYVAGNFMSRRGVDIASFTSIPRASPTGLIRAPSRPRSARSGQRSWP